MCINKSFILAGKAIFTVSNPQGVRYTFRVNRKEAANGYPEAYFAKLLTGPSNETDYSYIGMLNAFDGTVRLTKKSKYTDDTLPVKVLRWALGLLWAGKELPTGYQIHHEGYCGRCGRLLTVPESVDSGYGPECTKILAMAS